ncbi:MAG: choice-of-anchor X domain-containing protein [Candidatus Helarchaeota archaeon]
MRPKKLNGVIILLVIVLVPLVNMLLPLQGHLLKGSDLLTIATIIRTDPSGDVTTFSGTPGTYDPVDITTIDENGSTNLLNVTFVGTPASGGTPGWYYFYILEFDKDHDNTTREYYILYMEAVGMGAYVSIVRDSDGYNWNGSGWQSSAYYDSNFAYIVGNNMVFNFSTCPILIGSNWYNVIAQYTDGGGGGYVDFGIGSMTNYPTFFAGQAGPDISRPTVWSLRTIPSVGVQGTLFTIRANVTDPSNVSTVFASIQYPDETEIANLPLYDDGTHNDGAANDSMFANSWDSTGQSNGTYYIDIWTNDTLGNTGEFDNKRFFFIGEANATGLFDGLSITWTGTYNVMTTTSWNGSENYHFIEGNSYQNNHQDSMFGSKIWYTDNATRILNTGQSFWGDDVHDHMFIPLNTAINDPVLINFQGSDFTFIVNAIKYVSALGTSLECWELLEQGGSSICYYETTTGLLVNGTFDIGFGGYYYTILMNSTNAKIGKKPVFSMIEPRNTTYYYADIPILLTNSTSLDTVWYRNSTHGQTWSNNKTITYNGTHFVDASVSWADGTNVIQVFANNSLGYLMMQEVWFTVDTYGPWIDLLSPLNTTYLYRSIPVLLLNHTPVDSAYFRYDNGSGWSSNVTLNWNGSHFLRDDLQWADGFYYLQIFANDSASEIALREVHFRIIATFPLNISHNNGQNMFPKVVLSAPDEVHIFWSGSIPGMYGELFHDQNLNGHFGNAENLSKYPYGDDVLADVTTDLAGNLHTVWVRDESMMTGRVNLYYSNNSGGAFNTPISIPSPSIYNLYPSIVVDSKNIVHVVWIALMPPFNWDVLYSNNTGGSFNPAVNISSRNYNESFLISMAIDGADVIHLAYMSDIAGNQEILYQNITNGVFSTPLNISKRAGFDITPSLAVNSTGTVYIAWRGEGTSGSESEIFYTNNAGGSFAPPISVSRDNLSSDVHPCLKLDETPDPDIVFISWSYNTTYVSSWSQMEIVLVNNTFGDFGAKTMITAPHRFVNASNFAIDPINQKIHLAWMQSESEIGVPIEIYYTYLNYTYPPELDLRSPQNQSYNEQYLPILMVNNTFVDSMWYRYDSGIGWSSNQTLLFNGTYFMNQSTVIWTDGSYHIQIFANDSAGTESMVETWFIIDTQPPSGMQWANLTANIIQTGNTIWFNGTAFDPSPSAGLASTNIFISSTNTSASWSSNVGTAFQWAFYNLTPIQELPLLSFYEINLTIIDNAGNQYLLRGNISVDSTPPSGTQDVNTQLPQNGAKGSIWINGTAIDYGVGLKNVQIIGDNVTGGTTWSVNLGTNSSWSFSNTSAIADTPLQSVYEVLVQLTDLVNNTLILPTYIIIDSAPPSGTQFINTTLPQNGASDHKIWINGTAFDTGSGVQAVFIIGDNVTGGANWSMNIGTSTNWAFTNTSALPDNAANNVYEVLVQIFDNANNSFNLHCYITIDTSPPTGTQSNGTYYTTIQTTDINGRVWINGTASDIGVGVQQVVVSSSNVTGGSNWINAGTIENWAFYNMTPIPEPAPGEKYEILIEITDFANNTFILAGYITVDYTGPIITQNSSTRTAQTGSIVWINGTAVDSWVSVQDIAIVGSNITTSVSWSSNLGSNVSWSFRNTTTIPDGVWEIIIRSMDSLGNQRNTSIFITVDNLPPTTPTLSVVVNDANVTLSWFPVFDLTNCRYLIYQNGIYIANTTSLFYRIFNLPAGTYTFTIKAIDSLGHIGNAATPITVQIGGGGEAPPDLLWIILIIVIGAAIGVSVGVVAYRRGARSVPTIPPPKKELWINKALGYSYSLEEKLLNLSKNPIVLEKIQDQELVSFLKQDFTTLSSSIIAQLDQLPYPEHEKIEILRVFLALPPTQRQALLDELIEDLKEAAS